MSHFDNHPPYVPTYPPALGSQKLMELESANLWKKNVTKWNTREV